MFTELLSFVESRTVSLYESPTPAQITDFAVAFETEFKAKYGEDSDISLSQKLVEALAFQSKMTKFEGNVNALKQMETGFRIRSE